MKKLKRSSQDAYIAGVCGGLSEYFDVDPIFIRIIFVAGLGFGMTVLIYVLIWLLIDSDAHEYP